ncbi:MAG TPA: glycine cleavage T C-terminal barrel domain-containing protein [Acidimicrobiales bacterium]|nr:glycine cleavage T C-terminal barrel domain-containing protein [Acidimicrobiales bacterium]
MTLTDEDRNSTTLYFGPWYRKSPYFEATLRHGCKAFDIYNHTYLPAHFADPIEEYWHLLRHVTLWDVGVERQVEITGPDALAFTELLTPRDLSSCEVGQCKYVVNTDADGGIINDPILLRIERDRFWLSAADSDLLLWAKGVAVNCGMDVTVGEPDVWPLQVQGPDAKPLVTGLLGDAVARLRYYFCAEVDLDGIPLVVSRTGWTGEIGYELYLRDSSRGDELYERIMEAGREYDIRPIAPCEARRLEAGMFNYGSDMRLENNPFEVTGLERLVDLNKPAPFIGREALARIAADGPSRKLVGIEIGGDRLVSELTEPWAVRSGTEVVGRVTDAIWSPRLERNIGYAWVPIALAAPGTPVMVEMPLQTVGARTADLPFLDPRKRIPMS